MNTLKRLIRNSLRLIILIVPMIITLICEWLQDEPDYRYWRNHWNIWKDE